MFQQSPATSTPTRYAPRTTVLPATLEHALQRCILLTSRFGAIHLTKPSRSDEREFFLELDGPFTPRLRWTLKWLGAGTELTVNRMPSIMRLASFARGASTLDRQLERRIRLLPHIASLKIAVLGGGTGLYTALLGLRDRTWSVTAVISGLPGGVRGREPKDDLGVLPNDDGGICLVGLTPTIEENLVLRNLLSHRMESSEFLGMHFGAALLQALEELSGSRQAALDAAVKLLGIRGRILLAPTGLDRSHEESGNRGDPLRALAEADMIVIAPGHLELDLLPVLCSPGIIDGIRESTALKVVVTKIMTAEGSGEVPLTSTYVGSLANLVGTRFDVALANAGAFTPAQLRAYAAAGAYAVQADVEPTKVFTKRVVTEALAATGDLARHDPEQLGTCLVEIGAEHLVESWEQEAQGT